MFTRRRSSSKLPSLKVIILLFLLIIVGGVFLYTQEGLRSQLLGELSSNSKTVGDAALNFDIKEYVSKLIGEKKPLSDLGEPSQTVERVGRIAIISDSHGDTEVFETLLRKVRADDVQYIIHLGDTVEAGELEDLSAIKRLLDETDIPYAVVPGDHDYNWSPQHDLQNFSAIFGHDSAQSRVLEFEGYSFILFNNSKHDDSTPANIAWLRNILVELQAKASNGIFFFSSKPLANPYFAQKNDLAGEDILSVLGEYGVKEVFSGDTHIFSRFVDEETQVSNTTVGASGSYKNPLPQYVLFDVLADGNYEVVAKPGTDAESLD